MKDKLGKRRPAKIEMIVSEDELERKFFPHTYEKINREKAMKDPKIFEERLKEKLRKCLNKK